MQARFAGFCVVCRSEYSIGTEVSKRADGKWCHSTCLPKKTMAAPAPTTASVPVKNDTFEFRFPWDPSTVEAVKSLPRAARTWNPDTKAWWIHFESYSELCHALRNDTSLTADLLGPRYAHVRDAIQTKGSKKAETFAASSAKSAEGNIPVPEGKSYFPFQIAGINFLLEHRKVLLGDSMGLGKTIQIAGFINASDVRKVLVVCPASLRINWQRELEAWCTRGLSVGIATSTEWPETDVVVINYDILVKQTKKLEEKEWDLLVCDEAHYMKNPKAQRTQAVIGGRGKKAIKANHVVFLTGTPIPNRPVELWPLVRYLDPLGLGKDWETFVKRYCRAFKNSYGWDTNGASNLEELQTKLRSSIMIRRLKEEVLKELPRKLRQIIVLPANGSGNAVKAEQKITKNLEKETERLERAAIQALIDQNEVAYRNAIEQLSSAKKLAFTEMARARHDTALSKVEAVAEYVRATAESVGKVLVFAHHRDVVATLCDVLSDLGVVKLTGEDSMEDRQDAVDSFQTKPEVRVFVGNIKAAGVGLTLTAASHVVFAELDWVPGNLSQAEDRACRIGQTANAIHVTHLVVDGSIDAQLAKTIVRKQAIADAALDAKCDAPEREEVSYLEEVSFERPGIELPWIEMKDDPQEESYEPQPVQRKSKVEKEVLQRQLSQEELDAILEALRQIAGVCDGARKQDGVGFSKVDSNFGKSLAGQGGLSQKQAAVAYGLVRKYQRQVSEDILSLLKITKKN
jgi:SWI/SNF-related matrix-associated actin-dependent regulator 1 of chromatin subfamily A